VESHFIDSGGVRLHAVSTGSGPLVVFCHGFPGLWFSWRHQLKAVAGAGFRAVALDQRGYGQSDRPVAVSAYDSEQHCQDLLALLAYFGERQACFVGHDFGAAQVCNLAVRYPQHCRALVHVSCPYDFDLAGRGCAGRNAPPRDYGRPFALPHIKPTDCFAAIAARHFFHMHYFQAIGPAERELGPNAAEFLQRLYWSLSAQGNLLGWDRYPSAGTGYLDVLAPAPALPWGWMDAADFDYLSSQYLRAGEDLAFIGGLNSYRVADRNWELAEPWADARIEAPSLFIAGRQDAVLQMVGTDALRLLRERMPCLADTVLLPEAGHFVQLEQPDAFNQALLQFLPQ
jgi:pimeloyl-ACP methyl ester carboxylesterase